MSELQTVGANVPDIVRQLIKSCNAMKEPSLTAFLPLLRFEGHPYNLKFHFQLEPLYRLKTPRRVVLMTGRQVGKSQGLVSSIILRCGLIPNFHVLICEPQFLQVRHISNVTFRNMVSQSYISNYLINGNCNNSMLIREFTSGSRAHFAYIGGDASRVRGTSGVRCIYCDESCRGDTLITCLTNNYEFVQVPIKEIKAKTLIVSFDFSNDPCILLSVVKRDASYHGKRACFKITTEDGRTLVCTADHLLPTSHGKLRLSEVINHEFTRRSKRSKDVRDSIECYNGESSRGWLCGGSEQTNGIHCVDTFIEAERLRSCQVPTIVRVRNESTIREEESGLRRKLLCLKTNEPYSISLIVSDAVSRWQGNTKKNNEGVSESNNPSNRLSVALDGRWRQTEECKLWESSNMLLLPRRYSDSSAVAIRKVADTDKSFIGGKGKSEKILHFEVPTGGISSISGADNSLRSDLYEIQSRCRDATVQKMWKRDAYEQGGLLLRRVQDSLVSGAQGGDKTKTEREGCPAWGRVVEEFQSKESCLQEESACKNDYRRERAFSSKSKSSKRQEIIRSKKDGRVQRKEKRDLQETNGRSRNTCKNTRKASACSYPTRIQGASENVLSTVYRETEERPRKVCSIQGKSQSISKETLYEEKAITTSKPEHFFYDRIKTIEYVGEDDVYDIEVEGTHSYILSNGILSSNCDDMEEEVINIAAETMSAVKEGGSYVYTGTPKLTDGTLARYFDKSSGGEITIKCEHCNKYNIASIDQDLLKMIGKTTCICAKCGKPLDVRQSFYSFRRPELRGIFDGFHMSQVIHPLHCTSRAKWFELINKSLSYPKAQYWNEILGEPCDEAVRLITRGDLEAATTGLDNDIEVALRNHQHYGQLVLGIDWGGYGIEGESFTVMAVVGLRPMERKLEVLYLEKIPTGKKHEEQVARAVSLAEEFHCTAIAHDGTGAGAIKEEMLNQEMKGEGILTVPLVYMWAPRQDALRYMEPNNGHAGYYALDKTRSLALTIGAIKAKQLLLPNYKSCSSLLDDFLALGEDIRSTQNSGEIRIITRMGTHPDDTAHAINLAANALWHMNKCRPDLGSMVNKYENQPDWASEGSEMQL